EIGKNSFPKSGGSGGSTTIGGISVSSRQAATAALNAVLDVVAPKLGAAADSLEARGGQIQQADNAEKKIAWKDACALLGVDAVTKRGANNPNESEKLGMIS